MAAPVRFHDEEAEDMENLGCRVKKTNQSCTTRLVWVYGERRQRRATGVGTRSRSVGRFVVAFVLAAYDAGVVESRSGPCGKLWD